MDKNKQYRQGDVMLVACDEQAQGKSIGRGRVVLALGEATGHHHTLVGDVNVMELADGRRLAWVEAPAQLTHQEHNAIEIMPGMYWVLRQREYTPQEIRRVMD